MAKLVDLKEEKEYFQEDINDIYDVLLVCKKILGIYKRI
jgi:hypothetical protein